MLLNIGGVHLIVMRIGGVIKNSKKQLNILFSW